MKNKNRVGLFFALAALSLSMLNLGLIISKNHYKPQVAKLEQQVEELKELLVFKRIVKWDKDYLELEDGTKVTIEMSESDCCAWAGGEFKDVKLDAVITDVEIGKLNKFDNGDGTTCRNTVTIYHNQNPIALAECEANDGNGGYYYSIGSLVIGDIHFPVVEA